MAISLEQFEPHLIKATEELAGSRIKEVACSARQFLEDAENKNGITLLETVEEKDFPFILDFELDTTEIDNALLCEAVILVNPVKLNIARPEEIKSELVRTLGVYSQFPNSFPNRYRSIYNQSIETQAKWLTITEISDVPLNPHNTEWEKLMRQILGPVRYFSDTGFQDWQKVIDDLLADPKQFRSHSILAKLKDREDQFIALRQDYVSDDQTELDILGTIPVLAKYSEDDRALGTASLLVQNAVQASLLPSVLN